MNMVALLGNVASEPELRHTSGGRAVCNFRLAVSRAGSDDADFFSIVCWEKQAEVCKQYISIGRKISVEGRLHHTTWENEGAKRSAVEVIAHHIGFIGPRKSTLAANEPSEQSDNPFEVSATDEAAADIDERTPMLA